MKKKFNSKVYQGKKRLFKSVSGYEMLMRIWVWDDEKKEYTSPAYGKKYVARRYETLGKKRVRSPQKYFTTLEEALCWQSARHEEEKPGVIVSGDSSNESKKSQLTFAQLFKEFKEIRYPNLRSGTIRIYESKTRCFSFFNEMIVDDLSPKVIDDWIKWLMQPGQTFKSTRKNFAKESECLKAVLNWYLNEYDDAKLIMPFKNRHIQKLGKKRSHQNMTRYMSADESNLWLEKLEFYYPEIYPAAVVQIEQILRASEVFGMTWSHLDLKNQTYRLCQSIEWLRECKSKPRLRDGTKTLKEGEAIVLHLRKRTIDVLKSLKRDPATDLIFHRKGGIWPYRGVQHRYDRAFKKAGLPYRGTHVCRHTGATKFLNETGDELALTAMGGWKTTEQARHYGRLLGLTVRKVIDKADKAKE